MKNGVEEIKIVVNSKKGIGFKLLIGFSILLIVFLVIGQALSLINYDLALSLGLQESIEEIGNIGIVWAKGFAFGDTILYIPLLIAAIVGLLRGKKWGLYLMFGSLAISIYWPIIHLYVIYAGRDILDLHPDKYISFPITLSLIILYGLCGMWYLYKNHDKIIK